MLQYFQQAKAIQEKYTLQDFLFRWRKVQRILEKQTVDGLLLITGLNALDLVESAYLFNWLFLGLSGKSIYSNKYLHQNYSQFIILIRQERSYIFLSPKAKNIFEHLIYGIPNCTIFCPTQAEYNNKETLDTLKIAFFYQMMEYKKSIGVFLQQNQQVKTIEKWPMIQTYALEPVGRTFFTLQHKVINLNSKLTGLFKNFDKHSLKNLISQTAFSMEGHIQGATNMIELTDRKQRSKISQKQLQQSLQQTVDIGLFESQRKQISLGQRVKVLFGTNTSNLKGQSSIDVACSSNFHLTLQHYDPFTELQVWRTYFLKSNIQKQLLTQLTTIQQKQSFLTKTIYNTSQYINAEYSSEKALVLMYLNLVQGTLDTISAISKDYRNLQIDFVRDSILNKINQGSIQIYGKQKFTSKDINIFIESYDSFGKDRPIDFKDVVTFKLTSTFYVLKCRLNNITSINGEQNLGSVVFSECFLLQEGCFLLLTKNIHYFNFWICSEDKNQLLSNLNPNIQFNQLGKSVYQGALKNHIFIPLEKLSTYHFNIPILDVKYYFHENGIRVYNSKIGWKLIFYKDIQDLTLVNKIPGEWVLFRLKSPFLFQSLQSNVLFIQFRGKAFQILLKKINNKQSPLKLNYLEEIPPVLAENWYFTQQVLKKQIKSGALIHNHQILQSDFLWSFIEAKQLMILNMKDIKINNFRNLYQQKLQKKHEATSVQVVGRYHLLVLTGTYGSNKLKLAQSLLKYGPNPSLSSIFSICCQNLYNRIQPQTFLQLLSQHISDHKLSPSKDQLIITIIPSWIDCSKVISLLGEKFYIKSVIAKVNSNNFYQDKNKDLVENVLTFCLPGYAQNIILDSRAGDDQALLSSISKVLWVFNSQAKISRANNGIISGGLCADIIKCDNYSNEYSQFLRNKYSSFYRFDTLNSLSVNYLQFPLPLNDLSFSKSLSKTNGYLISYPSILKQLEPKRLEAQNSKDQLMITLYQLEQAITLLKRKQKCVHLRQVKGIVQLNEEEQGKQFVWANKDFREKSLQLKSRQKGFFVISNNYNQAEVRKFFQTFTYKKVLFDNLKDKLQLKDLTQQQKKTIQKENRNAYLQNGDYFDGYFYRNIEGYIMHEHPHLQKILNEWANNKNKEIQVHNQKIKTEWASYEQKFKKQ